MSDTSFFANLDDTQATPLHWAALQGNLNVVQALLAAEPGTCKAIDSHGWTALHWAAAAGQAQCVALLVRAGASLEARGDESHTPWVAKLRPPAAGRAADLPLLGQMFSRDSKAREGATPLHIAAAMGHVDCIRQLLQLQACREAANSLGFTALHLAAACNQLEALRELVRGGADAAAKSGTGVSPVHVAAACGSLDCLKELICLAPGIVAKASDTWTPLHCATAAGVADSVQQLLAAGADVEAGSLKGIRPLHTAAMFGHTEVAMVLVRAGADMEAQGILGTPIHFAASRGRIKTALALVTAGADLEAVGPLGVLGTLTPLQQAAMSGKVDFIVALAAAGASINALNEDGAHCLHHFLDWVAQAKPEDGVQRLQVLLDAGASVPLACSHRPTPMDLLLLQEDNPSSCNLPAWLPELIRLMAAAGCSVRAPLTMRDGTPGVATVKWWLRSLTPDDWAACWPATLSRSAVDTGVALLQCAAAEPRTESISETFGLVKLAMAAGSTQLVVAALGLLPEDSLDVKFMVMACVMFKAAMKELPSPGEGCWGERHRQVVHHYCSMSQALLAAGCAPIRTAPGRDVLGYVKLPGWAAPHLRELLQVVAAGQRWSPDEAHHAFPPAFRAASRALLLANHRGLAAPTPGSDGTAEPGQKVEGRSGATWARMRLPQGVVLLVLDKAAHPPAAWVPQLQPGGRAPQSRAGVARWVPQLQPGELAPPSNAGMSSWKLAVAAAVAVVGLALALVRRRLLR